MKCKYKKRDKVEVTIKVSLGELENLEDILSCIPLCNKHKVAMPPDIESKTIWDRCPDCNKVRERWQKGAWNIEGRLWKAYLNKTEDGS
jgi:hypothetical protein